MESLVIFGVVNGEVTTVVDPVVRETARKNSTNGVQMNNNNNNNNNKYLIFILRIFNKNNQTCITNITINTKIRTYLKSLWNSK